MISAFEFTKNTVCLDIWIIILKLTLTTHT